MQDQLEQYIISQKAQLDVFEPNDRLWERIDKELNGGQTKVRNIWSQSWKVAAAIALMLAAGALLWWVSMQNPPQQIVGAEAQVEPQSLYTAELVEVETYYNQQINAQKARIETFRDQGIVLEETLYEQMEMLSTAYQDLQKELVQTENEDLIINAMVQNLMMQMGILNQQLMILEEIKNKQKQYGNQKQS